MKRKKNTKSDSSSDSSSSDSSSEDEIKSKSKKKSKKSSSSEGSSSESDSSVDKKSKKKLHKPSEKRKETEVEKPKERIPEKVEKIRKRSHSRSKSRSPLAKVESKGKEYFTPGYKKAQEEIEKRNRDLRDRDRKERPERNDRRWDERDRRRGGDDQDKRDNRDDRNTRYDNNSRDRGYSNRNNSGRNDQGNSRNFDRRRRSRSGSFDHGKAKWGKNDDSKNAKSDKPAEKQKPNFGLSGKLTEETNTFKGVVIKYSEPPEARKPKRRWRLYPFKGEKAMQTLYIHRESAYLIGRERKVVDLAVDHPSCSKQHAALQYRLVPFTRDDGSSGKRVRPYIIDLESANGTFLNNKKIDPKKYIELFEKDVLKFGFSSREYVLLHENSKDEAMDDDVKPEDEEDIKVKPEVKVEQE